MIGMENVQEFADWGPLDDDGKIIQVKKGITFRRWCKQFQNLGYELDMWELKGCDYGAPTTRERLFIYARRDGVPIVKPARTHGPGLVPYRTAAECLDFTLACPSIFNRKRPLADNTLKRIFEGIRRYVINCAEPFIVPVAHHGDSRANSIMEPLRTITAERRGDFALVRPLVVGIDNKSNGGRDVWDASEPLRTITTENRFAAVVPYMVPRYGERKGQAPRTRSVQLPLPSIVTTDNGGALVAAYLAKQNGVGDKIVKGQPLTDPVHTITTKDQKAVVTSHLVKLKGTSKAGHPVTEPLHTIQAGGLHYAEVRAFLIKYYSEGGQWGSLKEPMGTLTTKDRIGLVTIHGEDYVIVDIGLRMLTPRELYRAQGFPIDYKIAIQHKGKPLSKTAQVRMCGNSVCPPVVKAILEANFRQSRQEAAA
jgi:DNA (cytosine-5)-methyltransferase 1